MKPKPGVQLAHAVQQLRAHTTEARNVLSSATGTDMTMRLRDNYAQWADETERILRSLFSGVRLSELHTERFWRIREIHEGSARPLI